MSDFGESNPRGFLTPKHDTDEQFEKLEHGLIKSIMFGKSRNKYSQTLAFAILADGVITSVLVHCFPQKTYCCSPS